jgi:hypothetical protein
MNKRSSVTAPSGLPKLNLAGRYLRLNSGPSRQADVFSVPRHASKVSQPEVVGLPG